MDSDAWKQRRTKFMRSQGNVCSRCGADNVPLHLHHKNYDKEFGFEEDEDLMLICESCHHELHQDLEFFDNPDMRNRCPECRMLLTLNECKSCGIRIDFGGKK